MRIKKGKKKTIILVLSTICLCLLSFFAFYHGLTLRTYPLNSPQIHLPIRIVLITDLHSHIYAPNQKSLVQKIQEQNPDLIFLAGDIADDKVPIQGTELLLEGIQSFCPIFYVTGNHEYWSKDIAEIRETFQRYNVIILEDEYLPLSVKGNTLIIAGVEDPEKHAYEDPNYLPEASMLQAFTPLFQQPGYKILLAHRPEKILEYAKYPFDLVVSGHSHGGQVRIPFILNGLFAPNQGWFPPYAGGLYQHDNLVHIVSRGISYNPLLPRIFNPPEIVVIELSPSSSG